MGRAGRWARGFELWATPRPVLAYVLVIDALAMIATGATAGLLPVRVTDWTRLAILAGCALAHIELSRSIERARKLASGAGPFVDGLTIWHFTAVLILPAP
ncbi:MAG: GGDEF domain-containing protein, partial [Actinomycetes bacterium]